jgi:hypothetical protein
MSVIVALISTLDGVVASDGRIFGTARLEGGRVVTPALVESEAFDKTFVLAGGKLVGAFAGLMRFSGKTVAEHVAEAADALAVQESSLDAFVSHLASEISTRLEAVDANEVTPASRKLDMLLVAGAHFTRADMRIVSLSLRPQADRIVAETNTVWADRRRNQYYVHGEDRARAAAVMTLDSNRAPNRDVPFLKKLSLRAVQAGIAAAGVNPHGTERACGGQTFWRHT